MEALERKEGKNNLWRFSHEKVEIVTNILVLDLIVDGFELCSSQPAVICLLQYSLKQKPAMNINHVAYA